MSHFSSFPAACRRSWFSVSETNRGVCECVCDVCVCMYVSVFVCESVYVCVCVWGCCPSFCPACIPRIETQPRAPPIENPGDLLGLSWPSAEVPHPQGRVPKTWAQLPEHTGHSGWWGAAPTPGPGSETLLEGKAVKQRAPSSAQTAAEENLTYFQQNVEKFKPLKIYCWTHLMNFSFQFFSNHYKYVKGNHTARSKGSGDKNVVSNREHW